ncbi:MAG: lysostaphin resistance A-like protein [Saprospiraceae bacterium]
MDLPRKKWDLQSAETIYTPITSLVLLLLLIILSSLLSFAIILGLSEIIGIDFSSIGEKLSQSNDLSLRNFTRLTILIQHLCLFVVPGLLFAIFLYRKASFAFLKLNRLPSLFNATLGSLLILAAFPLAQLTYQINKSIPLPTWAQSMEEDTSDLINNLLSVEAPYEFYFNLLVMALVPAFGEELIFRGIIQQKLRKVMSNPINSILLTAFLFSAFHMQFEGFLPRFLLGALLGFLFYWTQNLWVPILTHFVYNGSQIFAHRLYEAEVSTLDLDNMGEISWGISLVSLVLVLILSYFIVNFNKNQLKY